MQAMKTTLVVTVGNRGKAIREYVIYPESGCAKTLK